MNCDKCNMNIDTDYLTMEEHNADFHTTEITPQDVDDLADWSNKPADEK